MPHRRLDKEMLDAVERTAFHVTRCDKDAQQACAEVLEGLDAETMASFDGRSSFKTWLIAITRNKAIDLRRRRLGRRVVPRSITDLGPAHQELFRLYFLEHLPYREVRNSLVDRGLIGPDDDIAGLLGEILDTLDPRTMHRIHWDRPPAFLGLDDGRLLELHAELRNQASERAATIDPGFDDHEERLTRTLAALAEYRRELPEDERRVLEMKFDRNMTAADIADALGIHSQRRVYTMLDRSLRTLRRLLTAAGLTAGVMVVFIFIGDFLTRSVQ